MSVFYNSGTGDEVESLKTQYKLAVGYVLILAVIITARFINFNDLAKLEDNVDQIQINYMPSVEALGRMGISASSIQRYLYDLTTANDDAKVENARHQSLDLMTEVHSRQMIYNTRYVSGPQEQELFDNATEAWDRFLPVAKTIASDPAAASRWYDSAQLKQLMDYWQQIDEKNMALIEYKAIASSRAAQQSVALVRSVKDNYTVGAAFAVVLILFVWGLTSKVIIHSEQSLRQTVAQLKRSNAKLSESRDMYQLLIEGSQDALWDWDIVNAKFSPSPKWSEVMGFDKNDFNHLSMVRTKIHPDDLATVENLLRNHLNGITPYYVCEYRHRNAKGEYRWLLARGKALFDEHQVPVRMAGSFTDITERKIQADKIYRNAYYDSLTGLPNSSYFTEKLSQNLAGSGVCGAVFYIDLDNFKLINDSYGHDWGNLFLGVFAERIRRMMPQRSLFCRLGGDEFAIALFDVGEQEALAFVQTVLDAVGEPFNVNHVLFYTTASIGFVLYPSHGTEIAELLRKADVAMYRAKEAGRNRFCLFDDYMETMVMERLALESSLRLAIANRELSLHYQPIINLTGGRMTRFEALLRWHSKDYGAVSPLKFIPVAESTGLIIPIGEWVLRQACAFIKEVHAAGYPDIRIAVNVSAKQLAMPNIVDSVQGILDEFQLDPCFLELEITESVLVESSGMSLNNLEDLSNMGVSIALDDFGTGYSSLTYLQKMPIRSLKLDKSFLDGLIEVDNQSTKTIVEGVIMMAHKMGLSIVAEGIEKEEQLIYLYEQKCHDAQGYFISRPMAGREALLWLDSRMLRLDGTYGCKRREG
jgi:diguanylate cyclase (GGDEF)-like protein/PAS domain S-box-containing protein